MSFILAITILSFTLFANMALLIILLKSPGREKLGRIFAAHIIGIIGWAFFILVLLLKAYSDGFPTYVAGDFGYSVAKLVFIFATILISTNYWFVQYFIWNSLRRTVLNFLIFTLQATTLILALLNNALYSAISVQPEGFVVLDIEPLNAVYGIFLLTHLTIPLISLFWFRRKAANLNKLGQCNILSISYLIFLVISMMFNWVLPVYFKIFYFNAYGPTTSLVLVVGITYAIMRHKFLDIKFVIQRSLIYTIIFIAIIILYTTMLSLLGVFVGINTNVAVIVSGLVTTFVGIFSVPKLDFYLRKKTDFIFFKDTYDFQEALESLGSIINKHLKRGPLLTETTSVLEKLLRAKYVRILPSDNLNEQETLITDKHIFSLLSNSKNHTITPENIERHFNSRATAQIKKDFSKFFLDNNVSLFIPVYTQSNFEALITVGQKLSGDLYSKKDINLLHTFAFQAAVAFEKANLYEQVTRHSEELEKRVEERTEELTELQEAQRRSMLTISHGLQTPLTIITGELYFMRKKIPKDTLSVIEDSIADVSKYIQNLLRLTSLEASTQAVVCEDVNMSKLTTDIFTRAKNAQKEYDIEFSLSVIKDAHVYANEDDLREVVSNLLNNSIKYSDAARKNNIDVQLTEIDDRCQLQISDTGLGISDKNVPHIFDGFYRAHSDTKKKGTGLGLAIVKRIVEKYKGEIVVTSEEGVGTTFIVYLPKSKT